MMGHVVRFPEPSDSGAELELLRAELGACHLAIYLYLQDHADALGLHDLLAHLERVLEKGWPIP